MRIALLGAGIVGNVIARDLATWDPPDQVRVGDLDRERAEEAAEPAGFEAAGVDVQDPHSLDRFLQGADVVVNAAQYQLNLAVMEAAFRTGVRYLDLGGLFHETRRQLELGDWFEKAGLTAVLGMGSCPGVSNVHAGDLAARLDTVHSVRIYNGATVDPPGTLRWPYSPWTILDEISRPAVVFRDGSFEEEEPLSGEETFAFADPIGPARVHLSLHSEVATIPLSLAGKGIRHCEFKIHFFGLPEETLRQLQLLAWLGLASTEPRAVGEVEGVVPRRLLVDLLEERSSLEPEGGKGAPSNPGFKDIATVAEGSREGDPVRLRLDTTAWPSAELEVAGGTLLVAAPAAIVARWLAAGELDKPGVHPPETLVPPQRLYRELARRGAVTRLSEETVLAGH
ncbi:MAG: saccharopine dehydrogenase family protein [Acidimicrobiia bacterium]